MSSAERVFFNSWYTVNKALEIDKDSKDRIFKGLLTVQMVDKQGEILIVEDLMKVLPIWMKRGAPISDTHSNRIIGQGLNYQRVKVKEQSGQVYDAVEITGIIHKDYKLDDEIWHKIKSGEYRGLSFGGATKSNREPVHMPDGRLAYNLKDLEHYEVAVCRDPAVPLALFTDVNFLAKSIQKSHKKIDYVIRDTNQICIRCTNMGCFVEKQLDPANNQLGQNDPIETEKAESVGTTGAHPLGGIIPAKAESQKSVGEQIGQTQGELEGFGEETPKVKGLLGAVAEEAAASVLGSHDEKNKGLVEDQAHQKCVHCGYIVTDGLQTLKEHMAMDHPDKLAFGTEIEKDEDKKEPEEEPDEGHKEGDIKTDDKMLPKPGEPHQTHQETANDQGNTPSPATNENPQAMYAHYPERASNLMIDTPLAEGSDQKRDTYDPNVPIYARPDQTAIQSHDQSDTMTGVATPTGGGGQVNSNISNDRIPNSYDHYGTGRDTWRNEDQNQEGHQSAAGAIDEETDDDPKADGEKEIDERPKDTVKAEPLFTLKELEYVETKTPRACHTCEYFTYPSKCAKTHEPVDPIEGCCRYWDPEKKLPNDILYLAKDGKAKIKLEGDTAERLLESAGILPAEKAPRVVSGHKQYANPQPDVAGISEVNASSDTVFDPNPDSSPYQSGDVGMRTFKSVLQKLETSIKKEEIPKEQAIQWWDIMNPSQRQHALDPNNWYEWSNEMARQSYEEMDDECKRLVLATYAFRNDGKTVEGLGVEQLIPSSEGTPMTEGVGASANKWFPEDPTDTRNINATPEPTQNAQNTAPKENQPVYDEMRKSLNTIQLKLLENRLKSIKNP